MDYEFANGITISSITAAHTNDQARLGDFDYRWTADPRPGPDVAGVGDRTLEDFSQEIRVASSADKKLQWMIGASYFDIEGKPRRVFQSYCFPPGLESARTRPGKKQGPDHGLVRFDLL